MPDTDPPSAPREVRLRDLRPGEGAVEFVARVVTCERRDVNRKSDGSRRSLLSGLLSDGTATVRFTWWDPPKEGVERGTVLRAIGPEVGEYRGRTEVTFSWKCRVGEASPAELPPVDPSEVPELKVRDLQPPAEGFRVVVRVIRVTERSVSVGEERRVVYDGLVADDTGTIGLSAWTDFGLRPGEAVEVTGGYLRAFRGMTQLVLDERATVRRVQRPDLPDPQGVLNGPPVSMARLEELGGGASASVQGLVVGLLPPSGLVFRCPQCRRNVSEGACRVHGPVVGTPDLRARIVLDDGTGSVTVNAGRSETERLWGVTLDQVLRRAGGSSPAGTPAEELGDLLLGRRLRVRGTASKDDYGVTILPESIETVDIDLDSGAEELVARLGGGTG
jgi:ssDNA-binding replication factor A large subunit